MWVLIMIMYSTTPSNAYAGTAMTTQLFGDDKSCTNAGFAAAKLAPHDREINWVCVPQQLK